MKNLPVFVSLSIFLSLFGLGAARSVARAAVGDLEATLVTTNPDALIVVGDYLYLNSHDSPYLTLQKYDKNTLTKIAEINPLGSTGAWADSRNWLAFDGTYLWLVVAQDWDGRSDVVKINPAGNMSVVWSHSISYSQELYTDIIFDGGNYIWVGIYAGSNDNSLLRINKTTHTLQRFSYQNPITSCLPSPSCKIHRPRTLTYDSVNGSIFTADWWSIAKVRASDGALLSIQRHTTLGLDDIPPHLTYSNGFVYGAAAQSLFKLNPATMAITLKNNNPGSALGVSVSRGYGEFTYNGSCLWFAPLTRGADSKIGPGVVDSATMTVTSFWPVDNYWNGIGRSYYDSSSGRLWIVGENNIVYKVNASGCAANTAPNVPTRVYPPDGSWIKDTNPITFTVNVSDPDGNQVKACFDLDANGTCDYWSSLVASGSDVSWQTSIDDTAGRFWQAKAQDAGGLESGWPSLPWTVKKDTVDPTITLTASKPDGFNDALWNWTGTSDTLSGLRDTNTYYLDFTPNVPGKLDDGYRDLATTTHLAQDLAEGTYQMCLTAYDRAGNWNDTPSCASVDIATTGTISGYVWDDTNTLTPACTFTAGSDAKMSGRTVTSAGPSSGSGVTDLNGNYSISGLTAGSYSVCVDLPLPTAEWKKICPTNDGTLCESVSVTAGGTTTVNFGLKYEVTSWFQAVWPVGSASGDIHSNGSISIAVPTGKFLLSGEGVVSVADSPPPDPIATGDGGASQQNWNIRGYGSVPWPTSLVSSVTATDTSKTVKIYKVGDLRIDATDPTIAWVFDGNLKIIVANNINIDSNVDTEQINAILIAEGNVTVEGTAPATSSLKIKGAIFVQGDLIVSRELVNNSEPVMKIEFDPRYFIYTVPYFTQATHSWSEVR